MIEIKKGNGFTVLYDEPKGLFRGYVEGEEIYSSIFQEKVEEYCNKYLKKVFNRIPCIRTFHRDATQCVITSFVSLEGYTRPTFDAWLSFQRGSGTDRSKCRLNTNDLFLETSDNLKILMRLEDLKIQIATLYEKMEQELSQFSDRITPENIEALSRKSK